MSFRPFALFLLPLFAVLAPVHSAPTQASYDPSTPSPAPAPDFIKQNGLDAQKLNSQFATMKPTDSCQDGQMACVTSAFAQCVGGKWSLSTCSAGLVCYALPLVNKAGTSLACDTPSDAAARFTATGVDGGVTGTVATATPASNSTSAPTPSVIDDCPDDPVDDDGDEDCDDGTSGTDDADGDDCDEADHSAGAPQTPDGDCQDGNNTSTIPAATAGTVKSANQTGTDTTALPTPTIANQANLPAPTTITLTPQLAASSTPSVIQLNRRQVATTLASLPTVTPTTPTSSVPVVNAPISSSSSTPTVVTPTVVIGTNGIVTVTVVSTVFVSATDCGLPSASATLAPAPSGVTVSSAIPPVVTLPSSAISSSSASSALTTTPSATRIISLSVPPAASSTAINDNAGGGLTFISQVATTAPPAAPSPTGSFNLSELLTATPLGLRQCTITVLHNHDHEKGAQQMSSASALFEYEERRATLITQDRSLRRENLRVEALTVNDIKADQILRRIRAEEESTIWKEEHSSIPHPFPGMEFLTGKSIIVRTKIFEILSKMPKGALLHAHLDAMVNAKFLLSLALQYPVFHVRVHQPLTAANLHTNLPEFVALPKDLFTHGSSLTDAGYATGTWVPIRNARQSFKFGGPEGFDKWVISAMTINPAEAYGTHNTITKIWQKFTSTFITSAGLIHFQPLFAEYIKEFFLSSIEDGISYIEARINFLRKFMVGADGRENVPHRGWLLMFDQVLNEVKIKMKSDGREDAFIGAKIIYSTIRFITPEELEWYLEDCIALKKEFPHLIAGFDLVGDENVLKPLIYYIGPLLRFRERQKEEGIDIPFLFHAGETLGDGTEADVNLYDAILLGTKRIGHGYSLIKHPELVKTCRERGIAVEVCPISNEILRLTSSMPMHPLPALLNNGVPVALCSDDPAVFGNMGLTFDYYQVFVASEITELSTLSGLARDSIEFSTLNDEEKKLVIAGWERRWGEYVDYIVASY